VLTLRPLREDDLEVLAGFLWQPHVAAWWHPPQTLEEVVAEYLPGVRGEDPAVYLLGEVDGRPAAFGQWYRWDDEPASRDAYGLPEGAVGIDYLVGHAHDCERGLGTALVGALLEATPPLPVWVTPEAANEPSCRVLEKNGFARMAVKQCHVPEEPWAGPTALYWLAR
jgi:aminoglycoside 6'-N-acetyltransferase